MYRQGKVSAVNEAGIPQELRSGSPALFKRMIALSMKTWRLEAGLTQVEAAARIDRTGQHISNLESGRPPSAADLEILLDLYGKAERTQFMRELLSAAKKTKNWWSGLNAVPGWFDLFLGLESGAEEVASFETSVVPGLLQTYDYAQAVLRGNPDLTDEQIANLVDVRLSRQLILDRPIEPVRFWTVLDESVLYRRRGNATVMRAQLEHLLKMSDRPGIDIQVLPYEAEASPAQDGGTFIMMKFPPSMEGDPGLVYLELLTGGQYFEKPEEISAYDRALTRLRALAADPKASRGIIKRALKEVT